MQTLSKLTPFLFLFLTFGFYSPAQEIPFDDERWRIEDNNGVITPYLGRTSLHLPNGNAILKDIEFENGIIEVDFVAHGHRGFAGIVFRVQNDQNYELFYFRPHKSRLPDALQYTPVFNGLSAWQLYSNEGYTASAEIPANVWVHLKVEIKGTKADFYLNDKPVLAVNDLKHGNSKGTIGLWSRRGAVNFSNFRFTPEKPQGETAVVNQEKVPDNMIIDWRLSETYEAATITDPELPGEKLKTTQWKKAIAEANGLINISKTHAKLTRDERINKDENRDVVFAKTIINADKAEVRKLSFGYSDEVRIYLNGNPLFEANSTFRSRDPAFLGIVDVDNDAVFLPLKKGKNELILAVTETFGGWGFICRLVD